MTSITNWVEPGPPACTVALLVASTEVAVVTATIWPLVYQLTFDVPGHAIPLAKTPRKPAPAVPSSVRLMRAAADPPGTAGVAGGPARLTMRSSPPANGPSPSRESYTLTGAGSDVSRPGGFAVSWRHVPGVPLAVQNQRSPLTSTTSSPRLWVSVRCGGGSPRAPSCSGARVPAART